MAKAEERTGKGEELGVGSLLGGGNRFVRVLNTRFFQRVRKGERKSGEPSFFL